MTHKTGRNYKSILNDARDFEELDEPRKEIEECIIKGYNVKTAINELRDKVDELILNNSNRRKY